MIVMLNGSFGVGKTTTAEALVARLPNAMIFDPEPVGILARHLTEGIRPPAEQTDDFQDIALWRSLTVITAELLYRTAGRTLVVPMTLANPAYLEEIRGGLARIGPPLHHFCLVASLATIQRRLLQRGDGVGSWPWRKAALCVPALQGPRFERYIETEARTTAQLVAEILRHLPM